MMLVIGCCFGWLAGSAIARKNVLDGIVAAIGWTIYVKVIVL